MNLNTSDECIHQVSLSKLGKTKGQASPNSCLWHWPKADSQGRLQESSKCCPSLQPLIIQGLSESSVMSVKSLWLRISFQYSEYCETKRHVATYDLCGFFLKLCLISALLNILYCLHWRQGTIYYSALSFCLSWFIDTYLISTMFF